MNWTTEYPTQPGYYWVRNYRIKKWTAEPARLVPGPQMVELDEFACWWPGVDDAFHQAHIISAEWFGPIQPPPELEESECMVGGHPPGCRGHIKQENEK